ncbi:MAG: alanine--glyoxylate aminotransferase family protein [Halobacteriales archaeon SW_8_66_22]|nr:MAG: alanine--glyoxylate aminotransferase family protein [Halobacteriales archaeon SW_8_66_22]
MSEEFLLLNPGPVPVTDRVRRAMDEPMISHRSAEFEAIYERAQDALEYVFRESTLDGGVTNDDGTALILNGTATMGMEAAVANLADDDSEGVALGNGKVGANTITDDTDLVTMVHNETSTGLLNPVAGVGAIAAEHDARFVVDGVTSIGGDVFCIDDWHVDIAITDAQKALAAPPGTSAMYVTEGVESAIDGDGAPFYEDLDWHLRKADSHQTPFTSAVPLFRALAVAAEAIVDEGLPGRIRRHRRQSTAFRAGFTGMGLEMFPTAADATVYSNTLTAIELPEVVRADPDAFFDAVAERNVSISGGQAHLGGEIFRVSNMGQFADEQILRGIRTVGEAMVDAGADVDPEAGLDAARDVLERQRR